MEQKQKRFIINKKPLKLEYHTYPELSKKRLMVINSILTILYIYTGHKT